jgi:hypothetical protein
MRRTSSSCAGWVSRRIRGEAGCAAGRSQAGCTCSALGVLSQGVGAEKRGGGRAAESSAAGYGGRSLDLQVSDRREKESCFPMPN